MTAQGAAAGRIREAAHAFADVIHERNLSLAEALSALLVVMGGVCLQSPSPKDAAALACAQLDARVSEAREPPSLCTARYLDKKKPRRGEW